MRGAKTIDAAGEEVIVRELTVSHLDYLLSVEDYEATMLDRLLEGEMLTGPLLEAASGIKVAVLAEMTPSELRPLVEAFKEVNPDFFEMARREVRRVEEMAKAFASNLEKQPAS